jgi:DNA-binding HxlR family transcriptional regulator
MLILRDLLWRGPHGYQELLDANPGLSPSLLSERLGTLTQQGLVEKVEVRDGRRAAVYRLTSRGRGVEPVVEALYGFGAGLMTEIELSADKLRYLVSLAAGNLGQDIFQLDAHTVELTVDRLTVFVAMGPGRIEVLDSSKYVVGTVVTTQVALMAFASGEGDAPFEASGDPEATDQLLSVLGRAAR